MFIIYDDVDEVKRMILMMMMMIVMMMMMVVVLMRIDRGSSPDGVFPLHAFTISPH